MKKKETWKIYAIWLAQGKKGSPSNMNSKLKINIYPFH